MSKNAVIVAGILIVALTATMGIVDVFSKAAERGQSEWRAHKAWCDAHGGYLTQRNVCELPGQPKGEGR